MITYESARKSKGAVDKKRGQQPERIVLDESTGTGRCHLTPQQLVQRVRINLLAPAGKNHSEIGRELDVPLAAAKLPPWAASNERNNNLDLMRLIFAVLVIYSHSFPLLYGEMYGNRIEPFSRCTHGQVTGGTLAVAFFFVISGYLITQSWQHCSSGRQYLLKRVLRIYPAFIVMSLVCLLLIVPLASPAAIQDLRTISPVRFVWEQLFLYFPAYPNAFTGNPLPYAVNGSAWTIRYEFLCYILILSIGTVGVLSRRYLILLLFLGIWFLSVMLYFRLLPTRLPFENGRTEFYLGTFEYIVRFATLFLSGVVFRLFRQEIPFSRRILGISLLALVATALAGFGLELILPLFATYVIFFVGFYPVPKIEPFGRGRDISYGTYLYAFPVQQFLVSIWGGILVPMTLFLGSTFISMLLAMVSWELIERPFLRLKSQSRPLH